MELSEKAVKEFQEIYKEEYGREISDKEALEKGMKLLRLFQVIYRPIGKETNGKWQRLDF